MSLYLTLYHKIIIVTMLNNDDQITTPFILVLRKSFSLEFKRYAVCYIDHAISKKIATITVACEELCIPHNYYQCWKKTLQKVDEIKTSPEFIAFKLNGETYQIHPGCSSFYCT